MPRLFFPLLLVLLAWLAPPAIAADAPRIVVFGDSLAAGYELAQDKGFTAQLDDWLTARGHDVVIENAGVSGDTSTGGAARLDWTLADTGDPDDILVIVELGANDGLRGIDPATTRANLEDILERLTKRGYHVLLAGMLAPPNMGDEYEAEFNTIYPDLADQYDVAFYPFFLDGVAAQPALIQPDGLHPNEDGVAVIVERIGPVVEDLLEEMTDESKEAT